MRRAARLATAIALGAGLLAPGVVTAHHVAVTAAVTDAEAQAAYRVEYDAQRVIVSGAWNLWNSATIAKADTLLMLENAIEATITHLEGLEDGRACYALTRRVAIMEYEALAEAIAQARRGDIANYFSTNKLNDLMENPLFHRVQDCTPEPVA